MHFSFDSIPTVSTVTPEVTQMLNRYRSVHMSLGVKLGQIKEGGDSPAVRSEAIDLANEAIDLRGRITKMAPEKATKLYKYNLLTPKELETIQGLTTGNSKTLQDTLEIGCIIQDVFTRMGLDQNELPIKPEKWEELQKMSVSERMKVCSSIYREMLKKVHSKVRFEVLDEVNVQDLRLLLFFSTEYKSDYIFSKVNNLLDDAEAKANARIEEFESAEEKEQETSLHEMFYALKVCESLLVFLEELSGKKNSEKVTQIFSRVEEFYKEYFEVVSECADRSMNDDAAKTLKSLNSWFKEENRFKPLGKKYVPNNIQDICTYLVNL